MLIGRMEDVIMIYFDEKGFVNRMEYEEKSPYTIRKYIRDTMAFIEYAGDKNLSKETVISWKKHLIDEEYMPSSINSMLASLNHYLGYIGRDDCRAKNLRIQHKVYRSGSEELTRDEYFRLVNACEDRKRLRLIMQTLGSTGIRVSELEYFTVSAVRSGIVSISCKNKIRTVIIPDMLKHKLLNYAYRERIKAGCIFCTSTGKPVDRSNICSDMKRIAIYAGIDPEKVYPHNFRKLFAREFYRNYKDLAALADVLGHTSVETTRIYIMTTGKEYKNQINSLAMVK